MKRIEIDGKYYRMRRGKLVLIPDEWVGSTLHPQPKRKRQSKQIKKIKRYMQGCKKGHLHNYQEMKYAPLPD